MARTKKPITEDNNMNTCSKCKHWKTEQSIFDFHTVNGICLKAPESNSVGYHHPTVKTLFDEGFNKGKPCFNCFSDNPNERDLYFITKQNFGCIKFETKQL